jgi:hypothetical protein
VTISGVKAENTSRISTLSQSASQDAGPIRISTRMLIIDLGGEVRADTQGAGRGGDVNIESVDVRVARGGSIISETSEDGRGGNIVLRARHVDLSGRSTLSARSTGTGDAGGITILAAESFQSTDSSVSTETIQADGGNISLSASRIIRLTASSITATVRGGVGNGGNITIDPQFVILDGAQIIANAFGGNGGNVRIVADVYLTQNSLVDASSRLGIPGTIDIQATITDVSGGLAGLPEDVLRAANLLRASCAVRLAGGQASSLIVAGRRTPSQPGGPLPSPLTEARGLQHALMRAGDEDDPRQAMHVEVSQRSEAEEGPACDAR